MIDFVNWFAYDVLWGLPLIILMVGTGLYFTIRSGFFQFTHFGWIWKHTVGTMFSKENRAVAGDNTITPWEAICTAVGGTVGFGNIAGVATAVAAGGPGAVLWMWLTATLGMILKQVEVTLGVYYRTTDETGAHHGGPTYYMEKGLGEEMHWGKLWKIPAVIFAIGIFSTFFVTSSTLTASQVIAGAFNIADKEFFGINGIILASLVLVVITYAITAGGKNGVAKTFATLVPIMSLAYMVMGLAVILVNAPRVPAALAAIFTDAFTGTAAIGGFAGATVSSMIRTGMSRAVYSNEAGWGTSPMIHASANTSHPVEQGLWGGFEVFFDTFIVCSITALTVILSGNWTDGTNGGTLALSAFASSFGTIGSYLLAIIMLIFTVTTSGGWFTYYLAILEQLFPNREAPLAKFVYKVFYLVRALPGFLWVVYLVKTNNQGFIWTVVDITSGIPTFINVIVILLLSNRYFQLMKDYKARCMGKGEVDPSMKLFYEDK